MTDLQQRSSAWHNARRGKLTASNVGAALGQVSYVSRQQAFRRALGIDSFVGNEATEWGTNNEMNGITQYQALTGNIVMPTGLHVHKTYSWLAGSPDGLVGDEGMVEIKCPFYYRRDGSGRLHKQIPGHYYMQINALLEITERNWCDYVCWAPEGMVVYRAWRDSDLFNHLLPYYSQFYAAMEAQWDKAPPLSKEARHYISEVVDNSMTNHVDLTFWSGVDANALPPTPINTDPEDSDDEPPAKRPKNETGA